MKGEMLTVDDFKVQISGAVLDEKIDSSIRDQLANVKGLAISVDQVSLGTNAIKNIKDTLAKNNIDLQLNLGNVNSIQAQVQQVASQISSTFSTALNNLKPFSELKIGTSTIDAVIDKNGIVDVEKSLTKIKNIYSEFGKVKITDKIFNSDGNIEKFRINIEQVNGNLKETRSFLMALNDVSFVFPDDVIKGAESYVQHLNSAKDIVNKTGEALNQEKSRLQEQENYYKKQAQAIRDVWSLKTKLLSSQELETEQLEKQLKAAKERVNYNVKQINNKNLGDDKLERNNNDLDYRLKKQYELNTAIKQDIELRKQSSVIQKIDYGIDVGNYETKLLQAVNQMNRFKATTAESENAIIKLKTAYDNLLNSKADKRIEAEKEFNKQLKITENNIKQLASDSNNILADPSKIQKLSNNVQNFYNKNTAAHNSWGDQLSGIMQKLSSESDITEKELADVRKEFEKIGVEARAAGKLGMSFTDSIKQQAGKFSQWVSVSGIIMSAVQWARTATLELTEMDTILTEISKTSERSAQSLKQLGISSVDSANKYGATISGYLSGVQEMSRAGFDEKDAERLADLSILAQSAGDLTKELANDYLIASDAAYNYGGDVEKLNSLLDSQNQITNRNAVNMEELANATKVAANQLANMGIEENELTALLGTGIATSREAGETVGRAVKGIMMNLQQVSGETGFDGEVIDEESLKKVEARCHSVGVELEYMKDGIARLRDPMDILQELADVYNSLPDDSADKAGIISDIGGKYRGNVLSSILSNWDKYTKMLSDYENAEGSALEEAQKTAESWEGLLHQISNNWTGFVQNFVTDDFATGTLKSMNALAGGAKDLVKTFGAFPTLITALSAGLSVKNLGICA